MAIKHNFLVRARHMPGISNAIADALSRFQVQHFRELAPQADQTPCTILPFADDPLRDEVLTYAHWALSRNTNRTYNSGENHTGVLKVIVFV